MIFLTGTPLKVLSVRLHSKSHQKSSKYQNFLTKKNRKCPSVDLKKLYHRYFEGVGEVGLETEEVVDSLAGDNWSEGQCRHGWGPRERLE